MSNKKFENPLEEEDADGSSEKLSPENSSMIKRSENIDEIETIPESMPEPIVGINLKEQKKNNLNNWCTNSHIVHVLPHISLIFFYLITTSLIYYFGIHENLIDSLYLSVITFTTIGYGNTLPINTAWFALEIINMWIACALVGSAVFRIMNFVAKETKYKLLHKNHKKFFRLEEKDEQKPWIEERIKKLLLWLFVLLGGSIVASFIENWSFIKTIYWATATGTTIGYGDVEMKSEAGKIFTVIYAPCLVLVTLQALSVLYKLFENPDEVFKDDIKDLLSQVESQSFRIFDVDGDGQVTREEFALQLLVEEYKISHERIRLLYDLYDKKKQPGNSTINPNN